MDVICDFEFHIENQNTFNFSAEEPTKRMPKSIEKDLFTKFEEYKDIFAI